MDTPQPQEAIETPHLPPKQDWGLRQWTVILVLVLVALGVSIPAFNGMAPRALQMQAANNCRQIIIAMKSYTGDHDGKYPAGATANDVFRELFKSGLLEDERVFTSPLSPYQCDNNIGAPPDYKQALEAGENHWAMTKDFNDNTSGNGPLVFENPAVKSWPPLWNTRLKGVAKPGRVWKDGKIIIGLTDGSVIIEKLKDTGTTATLPPLKDGKNLFELAGPHEVLDVARPPLVDHK